MNLNMFDDINGLILRERENSLEPKFSAAPRHEGLSRFPIILRSPWLMFRSNRSIRFTSRTKLCPPEHSSLNLIFPLREEALSNE